jgi:uncharacterized protein YjbI with pentapeptide repeats
MAPYELPGLICLNADVCPDVYSKRCGPIGDGQFRPSIRKGQLIATGSMAATEPISNRLNAVNDASGRALALWVTFLTVAIYLAIAIGTTTHVQLLLETPVKLPLLSVDLSLFAFYGFAPPLFLVLHLYVLVQLYFLSRLLRLFNEDLKGAELIEKDRERVRDQLDTFVFTQLVISASESWLVRQFLRIAVWLSFVIAPVLLLLAFQLQFLPHHSTAITWTHRVVLLLDITLLWAMWPRISLAGTRPGGPATIARYVVRPALVLACVLLVAFSVGVATVPAEPIDTWEVAAGWAIKAVDNGRRVVWWPTWVFFEGGADPVLGRAAGLFSRNLVLIDAQLVEPDSDKLAKLTRTISLRGRDLRFAILDRANLQKADLHGARLQGASLDYAHLQGALLKFAQLQGASLDNAELEGASLDNAQLQGALLKFAQLRDASLNFAHLERASLNFAQLQRTPLDNGQLEGAFLDNAQLQSASLNFAQLQGASLNKAQLQGASLNFAQLQGASLDEAELQGALLKFSHLQGASLNFAHLQGASLDKAELQGASLNLVQSWRTSLTGAAVDLVDAVGVDLSPMPSPDISKLIDGVKENVPAGLALSSALLRLSILQKDLPANEEEALAAPWRRLEDRHREWNTDTDDPKLARFLADLGCGKDIHVVRGLQLRLGHDWNNKRPYVPILARALRDPSCAGAHDLTPDETGTLDRIIKEGQGATKPAPPSSD